MNVPESFTIDTAIQDNEAVDIGEIVSLPIIATTSGRQRLADVIVHAFEKEYI